MRRDTWGRQLIQTLNIITAPCPMDYTCPSCACSLKKEPPGFQPLSGQRRWLPLKTSMACSRCNVRVELNVHPIEKKARFLELGMFCLLILLSTWEHSTSFVWIALLWGGLTEIGLALWSRLYLSDWKRYVPARPDEPVIAKSDSFNT